MSKQASAGVLHAPLMTFIRGERLKARAWARSNSCKFPQDKEKGWRDYVDGDLLALMNAAHMLKLWDMDDYT